MSGNAAPFDPDFLDLPPSSGWLGKLATFMAMVVLGFGLAMLTALYPIGTILLARFVLKERIAPIQYVGLALAIAASALLALD